MADLAIGLLLIFRLLMEAAFCLDLCVFKLFCFLSQGNAADTNSDGSQAHRDDYHVLASAASINTDQCFTFDFKCMQR